MITQQTTILTVILTSEGLLPTPYSATSLVDAVQYEPLGVYTTTCTHRRLSALKLDAHFTRLEESARLQGTPIQLDRGAVRAALRQLCEESGNENSSFRIVVPADTPESLYLALEPLKAVPDELRANGVRVQTFAIRRQNARIKYTRWAYERAAYTLDEGIYQGMLLSEDGRILEGFSSNFYGILDGELRTAEEDILHGIIRQVILDVAPGVLPVRLEPVALADVPELREAFLTSSSRGVVPIVEIDGHAVGDGVPGPLTREIERRFNAWVDANLEPL